MTGSPGDRGPSAAFWRGRSVLVTGHTGFKGGWLTLWLERLGAKVTGYALAPPSAASFYACVHEEHAAHSSTIADLREHDRLRECVAACRPSVVMHLAAQALVRLSYERPFETFEINALGTAALLDSLRDVDGVEAVVVVTSDKCYANREWVWGYREDEALGGHDPYSASKACTELIAAAYRASYFAADTAAPRLATARAGNVIGGGDWAADRLIPDILASLADDEPITLRNPAAVRPWQHVLEPVSGYLMLAERLCSDEGASLADAWNFGPDEAGARTVGWIAEHLGTLWRDDAAWALAPDAQPHEAHLLKLDSSKARAHLGWQPTWSLPDALSEIVDWHRAWLAGDDMRARSLETIARFERSPALADHDSSGPNP